MMTLIRRLVREHPLALALIAAAVVRVGVLLALPGVFAFQETGAVHGSAAYDTYAQNLLATGVYGKLTPGVADAHLPPLYSYVLALVYAIFGRTHYAVAGLNILLDLLSIAAIFGIAKRVTAHGDRSVTWSRWFEHAPLISALCYAVYPYLIFQNLTLIDTPLFMALLNGFVLCVILLCDCERLDRRALLIGVLAGILLGLGTLTRANTPLFALAVVPYVWLRRGFGAAVVRLLPVAIVSVLVVAPWIVRNYGVFGAFVPVALNGGENFYQGNSQYTVPYFQAGYDVQWVPPPEIGPFDDRFGIEANNARLQAGLTYLRENPSQIPALLWTKFWIHWSIEVQPLRNPTEGELPRIGYDGDVQSQTGEGGELELGALPPGDPVGAYSGSLFDQVGRFVHRWYFGLLLAAALIFTVAARRWWKAISILWLIQIANTLNYVIFHPSTRYRAPTDPQLFILSAFGLLMLAAVVWSAARTRREQTADAHA